MSMELVLLVGFIALVIGLSVGFFLKGKKVPSAVEPSPDLEEKRKEANEIILKAKQEAQEILKKAQEEAREIKLCLEYYFVCFFPFFFKVWTWFNRRRYFLPF